MARQFQQIIHLLATDRHFLKLFTKNPQVALSDFDLQEEEIEILLAMHSDLINHGGELGPDGPFPGWNFRDGESQLGPNGPFPGWNFRTQEQSI